MAWPKKLASKITAQFFNWKYGDHPLDLQLDNPKIKEVNFFNPEATAEAKRITAHLIAGQLLKHMEGLNIDLETDGSWDKALEELIRILQQGDKDSSEIAVVIDRHFRFIDDE